MQQAHVLSVAPLLAYSKLEKLYLNGVITDKQCFFFLTINIGFARVHRQPRLTCSVKNFQCQLTWAAAQRSLGLRKENMYKDMKRGSKVVKSTSVIGIVSKSHI